MFGNPEWFSFGKPSWMLVPADQRGWKYLGTWLAVIGAPFLLLSLMRLGFPEGLLWLVASGGMFVFDYARTARAKREQIEFQNLHFIGDEENSIVQTENFELHVKQ